MNHTRTAALIAASIGLAAGAYGVLRAVGGPRATSAESAGRIDRTTNRPEGQRQLALGPGAAPAGPNGPSGEAPADRAASLAEAEYQFPDVNAPQAAAALLDDARDRIIRDGGAAGNSPNSPSRQRLFEAWAGFLRPLILGDAPAFSAAYLSLGGVTRDPDTSTSTSTSTTPGTTQAQTDPPPAPGSWLYGRLEPLLRGASLALDAMTIRTPGLDGAPPVPTIPSFPGMDFRPDPTRAIVMMQQTNRSSPDGSASPTLREMTMPMGHMFGVQALPQDARRVEVWTPARMAGAQGNRADLGVAVVMAWDERSMAWRPEAMRIALYSERAGSALPTPGGAPR